MKSQSQRAVEMEYVVFESGRKLEIVVRRSAKKQPEQIAQDLIDEARTAGGIWHKTVFHPWHRVVSAEWRSVELPARKAPPVAGYDSSRLLGR